ncbi:hypothetical protein JYU20_02360 [Bacteroidales bacterium AH-315-I05]|nr:hypothetical protein [Bacteroidales bacterium AH-315-I05]
MKKIRNKRECYYCGEPAKTDEHVPPRCIFPEQKDTDGKDYRKQLIKVPSCERHNLEKSKDDEFLMACLTPIVGNNTIGFNQTHTKLKRALARREKLLSAAIKEPMDLIIKSEHGIEFPVLIGKADIPRFCSAIEAIARGIYYEEFKKRFKGKCSVMPQFIKFESDDLKKIQLLSKKMFDQEKHKWIKKGENPDVFFYIFGETDHYGFIPLNLTFFEGAEVLVSFQPQEVKMPFRILDQATKENPIQIEIELKAPNKKYTPLKQASIQTVDNN